MMFVMQCLLLFLLSNAALATTYYLSPTGSLTINCTTIQNQSTPARRMNDVWNNCPIAAGDVLQLLPGTWSGTDSRFAPSVAHSGVSGNPIRIRGTGTFTVGGAAPQSNISSDVINVSSNGSVTQSWIVIEDLQVRSTAMGATVSNITFQRLKYTCNGVFQGVQVSDAINGQVLNSEFTGCGQAGTDQVHAMYLDGTNAVAEGNYVHDFVAGNLGFGIQCYTSSGATRSDGCIMRNNRLIAGGNSATGIIFDGNNVTITGNVITGFTTVGIVAYQAGNNHKMYNNTVYANGSNGIYCGHTSGGNNCDVRNNIVTGNGNPQIFAGVSTGMVQVNNACTAGETCDSGTVDKITLATTTACFVSSTDFHQKTGTNPCIDSGTSTNVSGVVTSDIDGVTRPQNGGISLSYDLGAYERAATGPPPDTTPPAAPTGVVIF